MSRRKQHLVFVYGTLMRDEINHRLLATARFVAEAHTEPCFELFDLGHFPAMSTGGQTVVFSAIHRDNLRRVHEIDQALRQDFSKDATLAAKQRLAIAHIEAEQALVIEHHAGTANDHQGHEQDQTDPEMHIAKLGVERHLEGCFIEGRKTLLIRMQ